MRALLPASPTVDLADFYGAPAPEWLRANFIAGIDGAASLGGLSRGLQVPGDGEVFAALRELADVVLVGAGTARSEGYTAPRESPERAARRLSAGLAAVPAIAVVTASGDPGLGESFFAGAPTTPLVITSKSRTVPVPGAEVVACGTDVVDLAAAVAALRERGLRHILCEGGPQLFATLVGTGLVDELCLTLSPRLAGPGPGRIVAGPPWEQAGEAQLTGLLEQDGALFARYRLNTSARS
jgi:riboflavin biosynthesis pyrimidine reductase